MNKAVKIIYIFVFVIILGCSHFPFLGERQAGISRSDQKSETNQFVRSGRIIDNEALKNGKSIVVIPFTAGVGVEASDELDKAALMIVKGVSDALEGVPGQLTLLTAENSSAADLVVSGHVNRIEQFSRMGRWVMMKGERSLEVDGKMVDSETNESVMIFEDLQKTNDDDIGVDQLGYRIGINIGNYILLGVK